MSIKLSNGMTFRTSFNPVTNLFSVWEAEMEIPDYMPYKDEVIETIEYYENEIEAKQDEIDELKEKIRERNRDDWMFNSVKPKTSIWDGFISPALGGCIGYHVASQLMKGIFDD